MAKTSAKTKKIRSSLERLDAKLSTEMRQLKAQQRAASGATSKLNDARKQVSVLQNDRDMRLSVLEQTERSLKKLRSGKKSLERQLREAMNEDIRNSR